MGCERIGKRPQTKKYVFGTLVIISHKNNVEMFIEIVNVDNKRQIITSIQLITQSPSSH